jgi:hypothetical protein
MRRLLALGSIAALALSLAATAAADGPERGTFAASIHVVFPAGTACGFPVQIDVDGIARFSIYDNPPKNIQHYEQDGTVTANGKSLLVSNHFTVTSEPTESYPNGIFRQRGASVHVYVPGGGVILLDAGYLVTTYPDGTVLVEHGQHPFEVDGDVGELCAALAA